MNFFFTIFKPPFRKNIFTPHPPPFLIQFKFNSNSKYKNIPNEKNDTETKNKYSLLKNTNEDDEDEDDDNGKSRNPINANFSRRIRRGRQRKSHVKSQCAGYLKIFSTN